jgi:hypothetical protein
MLASLGLFAVEPAASQDSEGERYTPTGSRIARAVPQNQNDLLARDRAASITSVFAACMVEKKPDAALRFVEDSDAGLVDFGQIGRTADEVTSDLAIEPCFERAVRRRAMPGSTNTLSMKPHNLRNFALQALYLQRYPAGATWTQDGGEPLSRIYPISSSDMRVQTTMHFADCVVASDPESADLLLRTAEGSEREEEVIQRLIPALSSCLTEGVEIRLNPSTLRAFMGEGLWQAATRRRPQSVSVAAQEDQ